MTPSPFFERPGSPDQSVRRILLISYHFPPDSTVGARRWEKLSHFVAERGWGLDVITCTPTADSNCSRLERLPGGVRVFGVPAVVLPAERFEAVALRVYRYLRHRFAGGRRVSDSQDASHDGRTLWTRRPDTFDRSEVRWQLGTLRGVLRAWWAWMEVARARVWVRRVAALARGIVEPGVHFAVVTSAPPHMTHDAGRLVSADNGLPFVMDMRDPWSLSQRILEPLASPLWLRLAERHERIAITSAALVVANTAAARTALAAAHPDASDRMIVVMNGSDDDPIPPSRRGGRFTIGYAGTVYLERDLRSLFRSAAVVVRELGLRPDQFGIDLIGATGPGEYSLREVAEQEGVAEFVCAGPARPHAEALAFLANATMFVTFPGWNMTAIPAKVFECVRFDAWLLALSDPGSATDLLLRGTSADVVGPDDIAGIAAVIRKRYQEHVHGIRPERIARDDRFSRRAQARILLDAMSQFLLQEGTPRARSALATRS